MLRAVAHRVTAWRRLALLVCSLSIGSASGETLELRSRGFVQADGVVAFRAGDSSLLVRRARLSLTARAFEITSVELGADLTGPTLKDAYVAIDPTPAFGARAGQLKVPLGMEALAATTTNPFGERSLASRVLAPLRDRGALAYGKLWDGAVAWQLGVFNGTGDNRGDVDDGKDVAARLVLEPWRGAIHVGGAVEVGREEISVDDGARIPEASLLAPGTIEDGWRTRWGAELAWPVGPVVLCAEWLGVRADLEPEGRLAAYGWYASGAWTAGPLEAAARIGGLEVTSPEASSLLEITGAVSYHLNPASVVRLSFARTSSPEETVQLRFQVAFDGRSRLEM